MIEHGSPIRIENNSGIIELRNQADNTSLPLKMVNRLRGITPTATVWDTAPTTLSNTTDGNYATVTGTGSKNMGAAGDYGILVFDMGAVYTVLVGARAALYSAAGVTDLFIEGSDNNVTWRGNTGFVGAVNASVYITKTTAIVTDVQPVLLNARYIRLRCHVNAAANTAKAEFYECFAYDMGEV